MLFTINILIVFLLLLISFQDFKYRAICWINIPFLFALIATSSVMNSNLQNFLNSFLFNCGFILFQILAVTVYFSLKTRSLVNITKKYIGWGDLLFLLITAAAFSPVNFIAFYLIGLFITMIFGIVYSSIKKNALTTIPLAGIMALIFLCVLSVSNFKNASILQNDEALISLITAF